MCVCVCAWCVYVCMSLWRRTVSGGSGERLTLNASQRVSVCGAGVDNAEVRRQNLTRTTVRAHHWARVARRNAEAQSAEPSASSVGCAGRGERRALLSRRTFAGTHGSVQESTQLLRRGKGVGPKERDRCKAARVQEQGLGTDKAQQQGTQRRRRCRVGRRRYTMHWLVRLHYWRTGPLLPRNIRQLASW